MSGGALARSNASLPGLTRQSSLLSELHAYLKLDHRVTTLRVGPVMTQKT